MLNSLFGGQTARSAPLAVTIDAAPNHHIRIRLLGAAEPGGNETIFAGFQNGRGMALGNGDRVIKNETVLNKLEHCFPPFISPGDLP